MERCRSDVPIYVLAGDADPVGNFGRGPRRVCNNLIKAERLKFFLQIYHGGRMKCITRPKGMRFCAELLLSCAGI